MNPSLPPDISVHGSGGSQEPGQTAPAAAPATGQPIAKPRSSVGPEGSRPSETERKQAAAVPPAEEDVKTFMERHRQERDKTIGKLKDDGVPDQMIASATFDFSIQALKTAVFEALIHAEPDAEEDVLAKNDKVQALITECGDIYPDVAKQLGIEESFETIKDGTIGDCHESVNEARSSVESDEKLKHAEPKVKEFMIEHRAKRAEMLKGKEQGNDAVKLFNEAQFDLEALINAIKSARAKGESIDSSHIKALREEFHTSNNKLHALEKEAIDSGDATDGDFDYLHRLFDFIKEQERELDRA